MKSYKTLPRLLALAAAFLLPLLVFGADSTNDAAKPPGDVKPNKSDDSKKDTSEKKDSGDKKDKESKDDLSITTNTVTIDGANVTYRATAGTILMKDEEDKP